MVITLKIETFASKNFHQQYFGLIRFIENNVFCRRFDTVMPFTKTVVNFLLLER